MNKNRNLKIIITLIMLFSFSMGMAFFERIKESIKKQQFKTAISLIDDLSGRKKGALAYYLKGNSWLELGRYKQAVSSYNKVIKNFRSSKWVQKAIFRKADALVKMKNFRRAYEIYEKQLKKLTSPKRRNKLAMIYKKLADSLAFPKKNKEKKVSPKYGSAVPYYKKALEMGEFQPQIEAKIKLSMGICHYNLGYYRRRKAMAIFEKLIKDFKTKAPAVIPKTRYYLALCYKYYGRKWEAKTHLYILARSKENIKYSVKGAFELLKLYNFPHPGNKDDLSRGRAVVDMMALRFTKDKLTEKAVYQLGIAMAYRGDYGEAINTFKRLLREYPKSDLAAESAYKIGEYLINSGRQEEAKNEFRLFLSRFPSSKYWQRAQQRIISIEYNSGMKLYKKKKYDRCIKVWTSFTKKYPLDSRNPEILLSIGQCWYEKKNYKKAVSVWKHLSQKYSGTKMASKAHLFIGETYANKLNNFEEAFKHYKKVTHWSYKSTAKNRIKTLKEESLSIETKKVFFTGEKAQIALTLRNLGKMDVKIYYFDLKTYFKKYHSIGSIEKLDIGLIDPDVKFTHKINKFKKYKLFKYNLPIRQRKPGAYLISCNSKKLKATTMLVISDIGLQVKVSPRQVFVFTSNLKTGRAMSGVDIIVSNGKEVFLNGKTGSNGVYIKSFKKPRLSKNTSVFAFKNRSIAACIPGRTGYFIGKSRQVLSYISTDRPVYRPGDTIRFKIFMRRRINGGYSIPAGKYNVTFSSPSGLVLYHRKVRLNSYGTVSGKFKMDSSVSQGYGSISISSVKGTFSSSKRIRIMQYQPKKTTVNFSQDKNAYFPGAKIKLKVKVVHLFGSPAANKILMYKLNKDRWKSAKTDASGTLDLTIDSVKYADNPYLTIRVKPVWQTSVFIHTILFLKKEYSISLNSVRKKYILNEKIQINIGLKTGLNISKRKTLDLKLEKYRKGTLVIIDKRTISTDKNGKALYNFKGAESGKYSLTVSGKSVTGEIISSYYGFTIVDDKDKQKIYILTKTRDLIEGRNPMIHLYSRLKPGLALLCMERDKVIDYRIIHLGKGHSSFRIKLKRNLFPNFKMTLSRVSRNGFHQTHENYKIKRKLKIGLKVTPDKKYYMPGQKLSIDIDTTDQTGRKRSAELALYVIDDS
ncbi:MAG: tetratricopeptide repeat protein, partial [Spirochaetes bacterium]|nr:tetratricopeptide repeat protein [Spirochaetota bacterium]